MVLDVPGRGRDDLERPFGIGITQAGLVWIEKLRLSTAARKEWIFGVAYPGLRFAVLRTASFHPGLTNGRLFETGRGCAAFYRDVGGTQKKTRQQPWHLNWEVNNRAILTS